MNEDEREIIKDWKKENPKKSPGPSVYWKTPRFSPTMPKKSPKKRPIFGSNSRSPKHHTIINKDGTKTLLIDRRVTDRAIFKPTSNIIF